MLSIVGMFMAEQRIFFIDEYPKDGMMDDLNHDGVINWQDANILYEIIDNLYGQSFYDFLVGGLGLYKKTQKSWTFLFMLM